jgi:hypothetical protein
MGYDSDHPMSEGEVGKCGVAVSSRADMEALFDGIPLDRVTTSMTINAPASMIFAFFLAAAAQFGLRVRLTALCLALSFGATIAIATWAESSGLPALPGVALGFLLPNADLLWRQLTAARRSSRSAPPDPGREAGR